MWERSDAAIAAQEFREAVGQEMHRMRSAALQMREAAAGGRKLIAETWDRIAVANCSRDRAPAADRALQ
jgi:hypothetical protein